MLSRPAPRTRTPCHFRRCYDLGHCVNLGGELSRIPLTSVSKQVRPTSSIPGERQTKPTTKSARNGTCGRHQPANREYENNNPTLLRNRTDRTYGGPRPNVVTPVNYGTVVGQTLGLESGGSEELRGPECASISDRHEHGQQHQVNVRWNHVLEVVANLRHETPSLALSDPALTGFLGQHNAHVFLLPKESGQEYQGPRRRFLSVRTLAGCRGQHHAGVFLCRKTEAKFVQGLL